MDETKKSEPLRVLPVIVLPTGQMERADIEELRKAGFCAVECKDPAAVRFLEPPPTSVSNRERAAFRLMRTMLATGNGGTTFERNAIARSLATILMAEPEPEPIQQITTARQVKRQ